MFTAMGPSFMSVLIIIYTERRVDTIPEGGGAWVWLNTRTLLWHDTISWSGSHRKCSMYPCHALYCLYYSLCSSMPCVTQRSFDCASSENAGTRATFFCNRGYDLVGSSTSNCVSGSWSSSSPAVCVLAPTTPPVPRVNGGCEYFPTVANGDVAYSTCK